MSEPLSAHKRTLLLLEEFPGPPRRDVSVGHHGNQIRDGVNPPNVRHLPEKRVLMTFRVQLALLRDIWGGPLKARTGFRKRSLRHDRGAAEMSVDGSI